ncbi:MAG TPA: hypothetical protein VJ997_08350 [Longimicrobiales bacterium]|nr:hypothetical protein [Longimicrobiales bacterium]
MITESRRNGFVLPVAIFALVMVGALVTTGFLISRQELRIGVASKFAALALNLAQTATNDVLINHSTDLAALATWDTLTITDVVPSGNTSVRATRLANRLYFLDATAQVTQGGAVWGGATRRVGLVARMETAEIFPPAALTTQGTLKYGGSSEVHGTDGPPDGSSGGMADWTSICPTTGLTDHPGILINDTTNITWNGNRSQIESAMSGNPKFDEDPTISVAGLTQFGDLGWSDMVALAEKVYTGDPGSPMPVESGGVCATGVQGNWGDPINQSSDCFTYAPIIYLKGGGTNLISGGYGQGILLVEHDLKVTGGFEFYGPVFVKGTLSTMGSGGHFWGGVVAANADLDVTTILGDAVINYSSCAVERALLNNTALTKVRGLGIRSWVDLSAVVSN